MFFISSSLRMIPMNREMFHGNRSTRFSVIRNTDKHTESCDNFIYIDVSVTVMCGWGDYLSGLWRTWSQSVSSTSSSLSALLCVWSCCVGRVRQRLPLHLWVNVMSELAINIDAFECSCQQFLFYQLLITTVGKGVMFLVRPSATFFHDVSWRAWAVSMKLSPYWWAGYMLKVKGQGHHRSSRWQRQPCWSWSIKSLFVF